MRVVVVEDHLDLLQVFLDGLNHEGVEAQGASCGEELDDLLAAGEVHLIILDVNLPGESGFEIAKRVRAAEPNISIIMLSARTDEEDRIRGYESGADFYLCKPIALPELSAAVKAVKRRLEMELGGHKLSVNSLSLTAEGYGTVELTKSDFALLKALALAPNHRLPYWRLFEVTEREVTENAKSQLELQVFRLRKKLASIGLPVSFIKSLRSEGYQLTYPIRIDG